MERMEQQERQRERVWLQEREERPPFCRRHMRMLDRRGVCPVSGVEPQQKG